MEGEAVPAGQLVPDFLFGATPNLKVESYDPDGAKKLLAEAGWPNGFGVTLHSPNDRYVNDAKIAQAVAQMWTRAGIPTKVYGDAVGHVFPAGDRPQVQHDAARLEHGHRRGVVVAQGAADDVQQGQGIRRHQSRPLFEPEGGRIHRGRAADGRRRQARGIPAARNRARRSTTPASFRCTSRSTLWATREGITYVPRVDETRSRGNSSRTAKRSRERKRGGSCKRRRAVPRRELRPGEAQRQLPMRPQAWGSYKRSAASSRAVNVPAQHFIANRFVGPAGGATLPMVDPSDGAAIRVDRARDGGRHRCRGAGGAACA